MAGGPRKRQFANQDDAVEAASIPDGDKQAQLCSDWKLQIKLADERNKKWRDRCRRIIKRYRSEMPDDASSNPMRMNVLWSNVQTLKPCVYGRQPVPIAERRFLDRDDTGRVASQILERAMRYEMNFCGFHDTLEQSVDDYLLVGRGVAWLRYKPIIGQASSLTDRGQDELTAGMGMDDSETHPADYDRDDEELSDDPTNSIGQEKLLSASLEIDYVHWEDFLHSSARFWKENTWVARRLYPSRQDLIDDFGEDIGKAVPLELSPETSKTNRGVRRTVDETDNLKKAIVYEIWDKATRKVYTIADGFDQFLEEPREDPLNLEGFFPCPKPLFATMTNDTLEPVPDYIEYQDQALEIDELTARIDLLLKALKVAGVYDASEKQLARLLDEGHENKLIPVSNWAAFAEKGGLKTSVSFMPIEEVSTVLLALFQARDHIKADLFEITGLSDVIRGQADPRETAEAVSTKGRWGSLRLQARQANVARFCRDIISMMGEIISEHFPDQTLIDVSGVMYDEGIMGAEPEPPAPPDSPMIGHNGGPPIGLPPQMPPQGIPMEIGAPPMASAMPPQGMVPSQPPQPDPMMVYAAKKAEFDAKKQQKIATAIDLLRSDKLRGFRIDIETDSTVQSDAQEDKAARTEFIKATTGFIEQAFQIGAQTPDAVPMLGKMLLFGVRGFRAGRDLESTIEEFVEKMEQNALKAKDAPPKPNPEEQKAQLDLQTAQAKSQAEVMKAKIDAQASADDNQRAMAAKQLDQQIAQQQAAMDMERMQQESQMRQVEYEARMAEMRMKLELMQQEHAQKLHEMTVNHQQSLAKPIMPVAGKTEVVL